MVTFFKFPWLIKCIQFCVLTIWLNLFHFPWLGSVPFLPCNHTYNLYNQCIWVNCSREHETVYESTKFLIYLAYWFALKGRQKLMHLTFKCTKYSSEGGMPSEPSRGSKVHPPQHHKILQETALHFNSALHTHTPAWIYLQLLVVGLMAACGKNVHIPKPYHRKTKAACLQSILKRKNKQKCVLLHSLFRPLNWLGVLKSEFLYSTYSDFKYHILLKKQKIKWSDIILICFHYTDCCHAKSQEAAQSNCPTIEFVLV